MALEKISSKITLAQKCHLNVGKTFIDRFPGMYYWEEVVHSMESEDLRPGAPHAT